PGVDYRDMDATAYPARADDDTACWLRRGRRFGQCLYRIVVQLRPLRPRVPAVIVSPFVPQGTVLRPAGATPFDHTSIIKTVRTRFSLGPPLSNREAAAPDLAAVLSLPEPSNLGPAA